ncbi:MAG: DUF3793 family protein [Blautia sp.]|nr:DUF3793 family protein [Blautia sp.]
MSDEIIIRHGSPTLAGLKTANLFTCPYTDKNEILGDLRSLNRRLVPKGVRIIPLRLSKGRALLYIYRPGKLKNDFAVKEAAELLETYGYSVKDPGKCVVQLSKRLNERDEFPHEIGLFLGYPPEDVKGFIDNRAEGYKCIGCWKVYGDEQNAKRKFESYKKCTDVYCSQWADGKSIERLTVAV